MLSFFFFYVLRLCRPGNSSISAVVRLSLGVAVNGKLRLTDHGRNWVKEGSRTNKKRRENQGRRDTASLDSIKSDVLKICFGTKNGKPTNHLCHPHRPRGAWEKHPLAVGAVG
ncbi:hypothetical protein F4859DRAFT_77469 [Xylaria cf. heliscus]|nr:hypothetical protein F4859DRAFT_77469 [Xylaria cf. heliscus]